MKTTKEERKQELKKVQNQIIDAVENATNYP